MVNTEVTQENASTKILKIKNTYRGDAATNVWCNRCDSEEVSWVEVPEQQADYLSGK
jgi:hypothetical protein